MESQNIYNYITAEEANYLLPVPIVEAWQWSMKEHIKLSILYKNSQYSTGKDDNKPFKNIIRPILNLQYRAEGFDVKDINIFVDEVKDYYKSFFIKKYHEKWARENDLDTFIDDLVESYVDFGGVLVKKTNNAVPEVVPLQSIAFCDQTDILSGPIAIKHFYSPDQLKDMEKAGWGSEKNGANATIDDVIVLSKNQKQVTNGVEAKTPGKYIEVYEVHGNMPESFLYEDGSPDKYVNQMQIVCFYKDVNGASNGITLFKAKEKKSPFKLLLRDKIYGRALGLGGAEELFEPQVWTNYDIIRIKGLLDNAAKVLYYTNDSAFAKRNGNIGSADNGEVFNIDDGKQLAQINTTPANVGLFERAVNEWEVHAQVMGGANDAIMGKSPASGTPFKLQELVVSEGKSLHDYRKGKISTFVDEIYRDWIIPYIVNEVSDGVEFMSELDSEEMITVADAITASYANKMVLDKILNGEVVTKDMENEFKQRVRDDFMKGGNKKFLQILKDEYKNAKMNVYTNIAGKQKYMSERVDKLVNVFRTILSNPAIMQNPSMVKLFNEIIEYSGLSPIDFSGFAQPAPQAPQPQMAQPTSNLQLNPEQLVPANQ